MYVQGMTWDKSFDSGNRLDFSTQRSRASHAFLVVTIGACILVSGVMSLVALLPPASSILNLLSAPSLLEVSFLNIGQGDATLIRTPSGVTALIDAGPDSAIVSELASALPKVARLGVLIASHFDADHIGGIPEVASRYDVGLFLSSGLEKQTGLAVEIQRLLGGVEQASVAAGDTIMLDAASGTRLDILWPPQSVYDAGQSDSNENSVVAMLRHGSNAVLLTGDAEAATEKRLVECYGSTLDASVLKVAHHGSDSSSTSEFLRSVMPVASVISVGEGNRYDHPKQGVVDALFAVSPFVHITKDEGRVTFVFDGVGFARAN